MPTPSPALIALSGPFASRYGAPTIASVEPDIFTLRYFTHCMACDFCNDSCCQHGVDVDIHHVEQILANADAIEAYTGIPRARWFKGERTEDPDMPGGASQRTAVENGTCVFLNRKGRGCMLHSFALERQSDYHDIKSMVDCLFPVTFYDQVLCASSDAADGDLICLNVGPTLYRGVRDELKYYFGEQMVAEPWTAWKRRCWPSSPCHPEPRFLIVILSEAKDRAVLSRSASF